MGSPKGCKTRSQWTDKQIRCADNFCNPSSDTYGNRLKSYVKAGYKDSRAACVAVSRLFNNPKFLTLIEQYEPKSPQSIVKKAEITKEYSLSALQLTFDRAVAAKDITNQVACVRLMMQYNGLLAERIVVDLNDSRKLEQQYRDAARRIAAVVLECGGLPLAVGAGQGAADGCLPAIVPLLEGCFEPIVDNNANIDESNSYDTADTEYADHTQDTDTIENTHEQSLLSDEGA